MYWLRIAPLADDLREGKVPERDRLGYVLATALLPLVVGRPSIIPRLGTTPGIVSAVILVAATVLGIVACFRVNRRGDGRDFVERFVALGWVATFRWALLVYLLYYGALLVFVFLMRVPPQRFTEGSEAFRAPLTALLFVLVYLWIAGGMRRASGGGAAPAAKAARRGRR